MSERTQYALVLLVALAIIVAQAVWIVRLRRRLDRALRRRLKQAFDTFIAKTRDENQYGTLGKRISPFEYMLKVPGRPDDWLFVTLADGTVTMARNAASAPCRAGLPVRVTREGDMLAITGIDDRFADDDMPSDINSQERVD